jgi:hypothetical protein
MGLLFYFQNEKAKILEQQGARKKLIQILV